MTSENSAESHAVCLVDDDPLVLSSLRPGTDTWVQ